jgi:lipoprotein-anchoring transpeptidase ErfK/SrfK
VTRLLCALSVLCVWSVSAPSAAASRSRSGPDDLLLLQVLLDRAGFSPGEIDGRDGTNTRRAAEAYATSRNLAMSDNVSVVGKLVEEQPDVQAVVAYAITAGDLAGPFNADVPEDLMEQAALPALGYRTALEALAEKFHASPALLSRLNPRATFAADEEIRVPNVVARVDTDPAVPRGTSGVAQSPGVVVTVWKAQSVLHVVGADGAILFHAPVTSGSEFDPLPVGEWKVMGVARKPKFNYNPELFWDSDPSHAKATISSGPNNPVGTVWIDIDKPHYGLHGTPEPARIGKTESHGCVRLTNWDAERVAALVRPGTKVVFLP